MKFLKYLTGLIILFSVTKTVAQTIDHSTIGKLEVSYKQVEGAEIMGTENIMYFPQFTVQLKNETAVSKLYLKVINETNSSVMIDVNYLLSSLPIQDQSGKVVFYKDQQGIFQITPSVQIPLNLYLFQLITEDQQGNQSEIFSEAH